MWELEGSLIFSSHREPAGLVLLSIPPFILGLMGLTAETSSL